MISKTIGFRGTQHFQTHPHLWEFSLTWESPWREHRCCHGSPSCLRESRKFLVKGCNSRDELHAGVAACDIFYIQFSEQRRKEHFVRRVSGCDTLCICIQVCEWNVYDINELRTYYKYIYIISDTWMIMNASTCTKERIGTSGHFIFSWVRMFAPCHSENDFAVTNSWFGLPILLW